MGKLLIFTWKSCIVFLFALILTFHSAKCEKKDLYGNSDDVCILDGTNLKHTLLNQSSMWLVEYYSSWCGTCHEFAPIYKKLAKDISEWSYVLNVAVVDCSEKVNLENCRDMSIDSTPTLRLYPSTWNTSDIGKEVEDISSSQKIREEILPFIDQELPNLKWKHDLPAPVLKPISYQEVIDYIESNDRVLHFVLVFEEPDSYMGKENLKELNPWENVWMLYAWIVLKSKLERFISKNRTSKKISTDDFTILKRCRNWTDTAVYEALYIKRHNPSLNLQLVKPGYSHKLMILDMSSCSNILLRRVDVTSADGWKIAEKFSVDTRAVPQVVVSTASRKPRTIEVMIKTRYFYVYQLELLPEVGKPKAKFNWQIASKADTSQALWNGNSNIKDHMIVNWDRAYLADIESAMNYMFAVEVSANKKLDGNKLEAVKKLVEAFVQTKDHFPGRSSTRRFMEGLHDWLTDKSSINYDVWSSYLQSADGFPKANHMWVGCSSDQPTLRGYPCGLWTMFHALSVACSNAKVKDSHLFYDAMTGYILNFFSCLECRKNFGKEIKQIEFNSEADDEHASMLWLWRLHNSVNARLHNHSTTEDPDHKKVQFPTQDVCSQCQHPAVVASKKFVRLREQLRVWDEQNVVEYLRQRYSVQNLLKDYLDDDEVDDGAYGEQTVKNGRRIRLRQYDPSQQYANHYVNSPMFGPSLTSIDFNLCLFFWITSLFFALYVYHNVSARGIPFFSRKILRPSSTMS